MSIPQFISAAQAVHFNALGHTKAVAQDQLQMEPYAAPVSTHPHLTIAAASCQMPPARLYTEPYPLVGGASWPLHAAHNLRRHSSTQSNETTRNSDIHATSATGHGTKGFQGGWCHAVQFTRWQVAPIRLAPDANTTCSSQLIYSMCRLGWYAVAFLSLVQQALST